MLAFSVALGIALLAPAGAQTVLELYAAQNGAVTGVISPDGVVRLALRVNELGGEATLTLGEFLDPDGRVLAVAFSGEAADSNVRTVSLDQERVLLNLSVLGARPAVDYIGELWIQREGNQLEYFAVKLRRANLSSYHVVPNDIMMLPVSVSGIGTANFYLDVRDLLGGGNMAALSVSPFTGTNDSSLADVYFLSEDDNASSLTELPAVNLDGDFLAVNLDASDIPVGQPFTGIVTARNETTELVTGIELTRPAIQRIAAPQLDRASLALEVTCFIGGCKPPAADVLLSESSGDVPLVGVYVAGKAAPDDPAEAQVLAAAAFNVHFADTRSGSSLLSIDPRDGVDVEARTIARNGQRRIHIELADELAVGVYKTGLAFGAQNAAPSQFAGLDVAITIERHWLWALIVLSAGVLVSFFATKGIALMKQRAELLKRVESLRQNYWLRLDRAGTEPIVRMLARVAKVREAMKREKGLAAISVPKVVTEEVEAMEAHLPQLERLSACMAYWNGKDSFVARRARKAIRGLVAKMQALLDSPPDPSLENAIADMEKWEDEATQVEHYLQHLKRDVGDLLAMVDIEALGEPKTSQLDEALDAVIECIPEPRPLFEAAERLRTVKSVLPDTPHAAEIAAAFDTLGTLYASLRSIESGENAGEGKDAGSATLSPRDRILGHAKGLKAARETEVGPLTLIRERLQLIPALKNADMQKIIQDLRKKPDLVKGIAHDPVVRAIDNLEKVEAVLSASLPDVAASLVAAISQKLETASRRDEGEALERLYSVLKLLWEFRSDDDLIASLLQAYRDKPDPEVLFGIADGYAWKGLLGQLEITKPARLREHALKQGGEGADEKANRDRDLGATCEIYRPITFEIKPNQATRGNNYLYKHGLTYEWEIAFPGRILTPMTREPRVTQFIPWPCSDVCVGATVRYKRAPEPIHVPTRWLTTVPSTEFGAARAFSKAEVVGVALAVALAVATGINSEYLEAQLLGSFGDYIGLFLWGFAADQARNIIQGVGGQDG